MPTARWALCALVATMMAGQATGQADGCDPDWPCYLVIDLDEDGFLNGDGFAQTQGDWVSLDFLNHGSEARTVHLEGYDLRWTLQPDVTLRTPPFELTMPGEFHIVDEASGDRIRLQVHLGDPDDDEPVQEEDDSTTPPAATGPTARASPALPAVFTMMLVAACASLRR